MLLSARKEYVEIPTRNAHVNNMARFQGNLFMTWFGGTKEGDDDVDIYVAHRGEKGWEPAKRVASDPSIPYWNPVLLPRENHMDLFYKISRTIAEWQTFRIRLDDEGNPVTKPVELVPGDVGGRGPVKNKCLTLKSGRILAPSSVEPAGTKWDAFIDISDDGGETFPLHVQVPMFRIGDTKPIPSDKPYWLMQRAGVIQPTLWQDERGGAHMLLRSSEGLVMRSDSYDEGETWCPVYATALPNNNSGIDLARLDDGRIFLALNPVSGDWASRSPLWLYASMDGGESFSPFLLLENQPGEFSYPCVLAEGNRLLVSYTWNRVRFAYWEIDLEPIS